MSLHIHKNIGYVNEVTIRNEVREVGPSSMRTVEYGLRCSLQFSRFALLPPVLRCMCISNMWR